jgi:hypothetical protein
MGPDHQRARERRLRQRVSQYSYPHNLLFHTNPAPKCPPRLNAYFTRPPLFIPHSWQISPSVFDTTHAPGITVIGFFCGSYG